MKKIFFVFLCSPLFCHSMHNNSVQFRQTCIKNSVVNMTDRKDYIMYLNINDKTVGRASYHLFKTWRLSQPQAKIENIEIYETQRNKGYGKLLLAQVILDIHKKMEFANNILFEATIQKNNISAQKLFDTFDFKKDDTDQNGCRYLVQFDAELLQQLPLFIAAREDAIKFDISKL